MILGVRRWLLWLLLLASVVLGLGLGATVSAVDLFPCRQEVAGLNGGNGTCQGT